MKSQQQLQEIILIALPCSLIRQPRARENLVDLCAHDERDLGLGVPAGGLGGLFRGFLVLELLEEGGHVLVVVLGHGGVVIVGSTVVVVGLVVDVHVDVHVAGGQGCVVNDGLVDGDVVEGAVDFVVLGVGVSGGLWEGGGRGSECRPSRTWSTLLLC